MSLRTISLRCRQLLVWSAAVWLFVLEAPAQNTGVYVGGHIRRERPATVQKLKHSGFSYVILFNINVETDGTLTTDGETVCRDGEYVFAETQPFYADDVRELKTWPTAIRRIEICIGGWGNESYSRIRSLVASEGTGESSILYRNFQALKMAVPEIDAVNNDDEHAYDVASAVAFHKMMWQLGYHTSLAPYSRKEYWSALAAQLNGDCPGAWGNRASSLRISPVGESGVTEVEPSAVDHGGYYDLCGRRMAAPPLKGLYIVKKNNRTVKITAQ